ncbi:LOW QUALITY PROTEIN: SET domain-containing protein/YDG_SRA domain-containing protein/Pre-SET domain-containing protein, partial [Cephalotus follicularis]
MGVVDNMLHTESSRMVSLSSGSNSEGNMGRFPTENGHCASQPKYKRRRVSAVRDFPPGCGRLGPQIISTKSEEAVCVCPVENPVDGDKSGDVVGVHSATPSEAVVESEALRVLQSSVSLQMPKQSNSLDPKVGEQLVSSDQMDRHESVNAKPARTSFPETDPGIALEGGASDVSKNLEHGAFDVSKNLGKLDAAPPKEGNPPCSMKSRNYPPRRTVSAIRDFPPFCGRNAPRHSQEVSAQVLTSVKNSSLGQVKRTMKTNMTPMGDGVIIGDAYEHKVWAVEGNSRKKMKDNKFATPFGSRMKVGQEDTRENSINTGNRDVRVLDEISRKNSGSYTEHGSPEIFGIDNQMQGVDFGCPVRNRVIVQGLMAATCCPWRQSKGNFKPNLAGTKMESLGKKRDLQGQYKSAINKRNDFILLKRPTSAVKTKDEAENSGGEYCKRNLHPTGKVSQGMGQLVIWDKQDSLKYDEESRKIHVGQISNGLSVSIPPSRPISSSVEGDASAAGVTRNKVRETLRLFQAICRKLLQDAEAKSKGHVRIDLEAASILKNKSKYLNTGKQIIGSVPGVLVGDEFQYRVELNIIGLHRPIQGGIDYLKQGAKVLATSIVASGGYDDDLDKSDVLTYTGQGGLAKGDKEAEDQKLERGNLALVNSIQEQNPVRVIHRENDSADARAKTYIYDGLYLVEKYWQDVNQQGKLVFKFRLVRIPGQPELAWKVVSKSKKCRSREGLCVDDISRGKELIPIFAVNTIGNEKPPPFEYTSGMIYPDWCHPIPPKGCDCTNGCSESGKCICVLKNGGEIPYNHNGSIVEAKPLVYECGPSCKCPPSCYNRVSQRGIKFQLEIFRTESRGWGVRSLNFIPSGGFVCEYAGELLEDKEAERRTGNDEYLFDIGNNYNDSSLWDGLSTLMPDSQSISREFVENGGFTIDAARFGNVGRFINHSCSPNLYAQNVLYDHQDKRIPHIMLFAAENIPPLQELTYHYNYMIDQVRDSNGNIKKKSCYCGSSECTGRMY